MELPRVIAVLGGTGAMGRGLAARFLRAGREVVLGSRDEAKARAAAERLGGGARGASNDDAAAEAELVVLSVPFAHHEATLRELKGALEGKILVDVTAPLRPPKVDVVQLPPGGSAALQARAIVGDGVRVVSAFQNVSARHLEGDHPVDCDVLVTGDDAPACEIVIGLARAAGMRALWAGPLANAVAAESLAAVLIHLNRRYKIAGSGIRITGEIKSHG